MIIDDEKLYYNNKENKHIMERIIALMCCWVHLNVKFTTGHRLNFSCHDALDT